MTPQTSSHGASKVYGIERTSSAKRRKYTPEILPLKIHHNGPVNATDRHWRSSQNSDGTRTAYFRGRELCGRSIKLPEGYRGAILRKSARTTRDAPAHTQKQQQLEKKLQQQAIGPEEYNEELRSLAQEPDTSAPDILMMDEIGTFDSLNVWVHDVPPDDAESPYQRGINEWLDLARTIHTKKLLSEVKSTPQPVE
ncbi:MAG: hypothetical protein M1828_003405 [Chrysothrix sp. TS-e1954]|nr:MAG: hypothetical protein M1828_003405 [Chrysothrix sp. TS-e1954]